MYKSYLLEVARTKKSPLIPIITFIMCLVLHVIMHVNDLVSTNLQQLLMVTPPLSCPSPPLVSVPPSLVTLLDISAASSISKTVSMPLPSWLSAPQSLVSNQWISNLSRHAEIGFLNYQRHIVVKYVAFLA